MAARRMRYLAKTWQGLTTKQQVVLVLAVFLLLVEVISLAIERRAIETRVAERAHIATVEYAVSVLPLVLKQDGATRAEIAKSLETSHRKITLSDTPDADGQPVTLSTTSANALNLAVSSLRALQLSERLVTSQDGAAMRAVVLSVLPTGQDTWLLVETLSRDAQTRRPLLATALLESVLALLLIGVILLIVGRMLGPLGSLAHNAELLSHGEQPTDISAANSGTDIRVTIRSFNHMSMIMAQSVRYQRSLLMSIGHDLKTPLAHAETLVREEVDDPTRSRVLSALDQARTTLSLVTEFTRATLRDGKVEIVELTSLLSALVEEAQERGRAVTIDAPEIDVSVLGHYNALTRALRNLIENAAKYGSKAHVSLRTREGNAIVEIDDDGPGIPPDMMEAALRPFRRLADDPGGTGLGLPIAKTIVVDNGGTLDLVNRPEGGLTARVTLPMYHAASEGRSI